MARSDGILLVTHYNDVYVHIECDRGTAQELSDYFTFRVPGCHFMPSYKNKMWDGNIRLFSTQTHLVYAGLVEYIKQFATERKYTVVEQKKNDIVATDEELKAFLSKFKPKSQGKQLTIRDYQQKGFLRAIKDRRCVLVSPTASGKSLIIYMLISFLLNSASRATFPLKKKILIVVPTTNLVEQMYSDFDDYGMNVKKDCQRVYQGHSRTLSKRVVISTWQSIYRQPRKFFDSFYCVIGDEAHGFKSQSLTSIMTKLETCPYRIGTTGTLDDSNIHQLVLEGLFGPVDKITTTKELMEKESLATLTISCLVLKYAKKDCYEVKSMPYHEELEFIVGHVKRNRVIQNLALKLEGNTLVLFKLVEKHGKNLYQMIREKAKKNRKVFFISGKTAVEDREAIRHITEKQKNAIIVASYGTFSTGVNIRNLHNIVFASPSKSRIRTLQSIGRGLRLAKEKTFAQLYDVVDNLEYGRRKNYTLNHFLERLKLYNEEQFDYTIHNIDL